MKKILALSLFVVVFAAGGVFAQEDLGPATGAVANLEAGFPTQIVDTTVTPAGEIELGVAGGYVTNGITFETVRLQANYGLTEGVQLSADMPLVIGQGLVPGNGDINVDVLWAFLAEEGSIPSLGVIGGVKFPSGEGYTGWDGKVVLVATKTLGEARAHLNAGYTTLGSNGAAPVRADTDAIALGLDYPILDNLVLIGDIVSAEHPVKGADRLEFIEVGGRYALTEVDTLSAGISIGIGNGNATPDFAATVGYQRAL